MSDDIAQRIARVDASLAKQLRDSMERNARLKNQLRALVDMPSLPAEVVTAIRQILNDGPLTLHLVEPSLLEIDPRPCGLCGLKIDRHERDNTPEGPLFFCADVSPDEMTLIELERRAELRLQEQVAAMVERMESADPRDRWRHTGEPPPPIEVRNGPMEAAPPRAPEAYRPPQPTVDAFWFVVALKDPAKLAVWLRDRERDAPSLLKLLEAK